MVTKITLVNVVCKRLKMGQRQIENLLPHGLIAVLKNPRKKLKKNHNDLNKFVIHLQQFGMLKYIT